MNVEDRVDRLAARATRERDAFAQPADPPDEERAGRYLREGVGEAVAVYIAARTGEEGPTAVDPTTFTRLEESLNTWLELYAACYGRKIDAAFTLREAAELVLATHDLRDTARLLTKIPGR